MTENRFVSLAPDDPDNSDTDPEVTEPHSANKPQDEGSTVSDDTVYYDAQDDTISYRERAKEIEYMMGIFVMSWEILLHNLMNRDSNRNHPDD